MTRSTDYTDARHEFIYPPPNALPLDPFLSRGTADWKWKCAVSHQGKTMCKCKRWGLRGRGITFCPFLPWCWMTLQGLGSGRGATGKTVLRLPRLWHGCHRLWG